MGKKKGGRGPNQKGRNKDAAQYMPIPYSMAHSEAFRSLSGSAVKVFIELHCRFNGRNNGFLSVSYQQAATTLQMSKSTVQRAFAELEDKGFVKRRFKGSWYGRKAAEYIVTTKDYAGQQATRDWQKWRPQPAVKKQKSVPRRDAKPACAPDGYRTPSTTDRTDTRQSHLRIVDGAA